MRSMQIHKAQVRCTAIPYREVQGNPCNENREPAMRTGFPWKWKQVFPCGNWLTGNSCKHYRVWVYSKSHRQETFISHHLKSWSLLFDKLNYISLFLLFSGPLNIFCTNIPIFLFLPLIVICQVLWNAGQCPPYLQTLSCLIQKLIFWLLSN